MSGVDDMFQHIKQMMGMTTTVVVCKLRPEHLLEYKKRRSEKNKKAEEAKLLVAKLEVIQAEMNVMNGELWQWIYKEYGLPSDQKYEIDKDGVIVKHVDKKSDERHE